MNQKIAIFDIDGTLFRWQLYHELVFELKYQGKLSTESSKILESSLINWKDLKIKWLDYSLDVIHVLESELKGLSADDVNLATQAVLKRKSNRVHHYTYTLAKKLKKEGYFLLAITGSQQEIAAPFAKQYGFDDCIGVILELDANNNYTGKQIRSVYDDKDILLQQYVGEKNLSLKDSIAIGDSGSDIPMLKIATTPIAFNPDNDLYQAATEHGWKIVIERKNLAYELNQKNNEYILNKVTDY